MAGGYTGSIALTIGGTGDASYIASQRSTGSWRVLRAVASVHRGASIGIVSQSAGLIGGDTQTLTASVCPGAWGNVFPIAAELILPGNQPADQQIDIDVGEGGKFLWLAEPTIPYPHSRLNRRVRVNRASNTTLVLEEMVMAGRLTRNERFCDLNIDSTTQIVKEGKLALLERLQIVPESAMFWGGFDGYLSIILCSPKVTQINWADIVNTATIFAGWTEMKSAACVVIRALGSYSEMKTFVERMREKYAFL